MKKFYIYDDTNITLNDWLSHLPTLHRGYLDEDLYKNFQNNYMRTLQPQQAHIFIIGIPMVKSYVRDNINHIENMIKQF